MVLTILSKFLGITIGDKKNNSNKNKKDTQTLVVLSTSQRDTFTQSHTIMQIFML